MAGRMTSLSLSSPMFLATGKEEKERIRGPQHLRREESYPGLGTPASVPSSQSKITPRRIFCHLGLGTVELENSSLSLSFPTRKTVNWWCRNPLPALEKCTQEDVEFKASLAT